MFKTFSLLLSFFVCGIISGFAQISWTISNTGLPSAFMANDIDTSGTDLYAMGSFWNGSTFVAQFYKSTNNGGNWSQINGNGLSTITTGNALLNFNGKFLMAGSTPGSTNCVLLASTDNGANWINSNSGLPAGFTANAMEKSGTDVFIAGAYSNGSNWQGRIYRSTDAGLTWTQLITSGLSLSTGNGLIKFKDKLLVSGNTAANIQQSTVLISNDNGQSWTTSNNGLPSNFLVNDFAFNGTDLVAAGSQSTSGGFIGKIYKSSDDGASWSIINTTGLTNVTSGNALQYFIHKFFFSGYLNQNLLTTGLYSSNAEIVTDLQDAGIDQKLNIFPNPAKDKLFLKIPGSVTNYAIYNSLGSLVMSGHIVNEIEIGSLEPGLYFVKTGDSKITKIIVE